MPEIAWSLMVAVYSGSISWSTYHHAFFFWWEVFHA